MQILLKQILFKCNSSLNQRTFFIKFVQLYMMNVYLATQWSWPWHRCRRQLVTLGARWKRYHFTSRCLGQSNFVFFDTTETNTSAKTSFGFDVKKCMHCWRNWTRSHWKEKWLVVPSTATTTTSKCWQTKSSSYATAGYFFIIQINNFYLLHNFYLIFDYKLTVKTSVLKFNFYDNKLTLSWKHY